MSRSAPPPPIPPAAESFGTGGWTENKSSPAFAGEGDHAKHGGGALLNRKNPSTALRAVPLPRKSGGGIKGNRRRRAPGAQPADPQPAPAPFATARHRARRRASSRPADR